MYTTRDLASYVEVNDQSLGVTVDTPTLKSPFAALSKIGECGHTMQR